ncbi:MAG: FKBP-type peptidyl-prolyl cis-trans isomerase [Gracilimonas sp.]|uniref:FKBP-type peptidyl-prolyl cis-trans isomerase N-terminal domain-containing protein n=1 Tax=Gracilimonas sp. TaxID=1974203 RepID=UPI0019827BD6|nr:FKBP-type peptidyl-prolyl cis-trans isomerase [Gracilimonas sp.]MBD3615832.1 FKBP-type peptidyl-prolyl cis-trans isomerase [Gracilimonas sp.]
MKLNKLSIAAILSSLLLISACDQKMSGTYEADLSTQLDSVSYALGYQNGMMLKTESIDEVDIHNYNAGLSDGLEGEELMSRDEVFKIINTYIQEISELKGAENLEKGQAFLEENKDKEGVMVTDSGLQYKVIEEGDGESPSAENIVRVHYTGRLVDGTIFDTSRKDVAQANDLYNAQREPYEGAEFPLNRVIPGWTEGVQLMSEGAIYEFYIPSDLAYGAQAPRGSSIGPNETLIFKVELLEVKPAE